MTGNFRIPSGRPYRTVFEPTKSRNLQGKTLLELLLAHYDDLGRLLALTAERCEPATSIDGVSAK